MLLVILTAIALIQTGEFLQSGEAQNLCHGVLYEDHMSHFLNTFHEVYKFGVEAQTLYSFIST